MKGPTIGKAAEIDQRAVRIFLDALPASWLARDLKPDVHIDYLVELVEAGELTGINFGAQIKGFKSPSGAPPRLKHALRTKHLAYYLDKVQFPVFLFHVDTTTRTILYRFMQETGKGWPHGWRAQKSLTLELNTLDNFSDQLRFTSELARANEYTRDLHPSSPQAALAKLKQKIETTDPRIDVRIDVIDGKQHFHVTPKKNHSFTIQLKNQSPENKAAFLDFIEKGKDLILNAQDVAFGNAPLFERLFEGQIKVTHREEVSGHLLLSSKAGEPPFRVQIPAVFWRGTKYICVRGGFPDSPLQMECEFQPELWNKNHPFTCKFRTVFKAWEGKPINSLPYFDTFHEFAEILANRNSIDIKFFIQGNLYGTVAVGSEDRAMFRDLFSIVDLTRKVREISAKLGGSPSVPPVNEIGRKDFRVVDELYRVLFEGQSQRKIGAGTATGVFEDNGTLPPPDPKSATLTITYPRTIYKIWDVEFIPGPLQRDYSEMRVSSFKRKANGRSVQIKWKGSPESIETTRLCGAEGPLQANAGQNAIPDTTS